MKSLVDLQKEIAEEESKYLKNWRRYVDIIKKRAMEHIGHAKVVVFGSVVTGEWIAGKSDIDVLIISENCPRDGRSQTNLCKILTEGFNEAPFEIHFIKPETYEKWYKKFIGEKYIEV